MIKTILKSNTENKLKKALQKNLEETVHYLSVELGERTLRKYDNLNNAKEYIKNYFLKYGYEAKEEKYTAEGKEVSNIIVDIKGEESPDDIILLGGHYDTVEGSPGADDNATAIAAMLEIFKMFIQTKSKKTLRLVAFTLEEPPFFATDLMGSMQHASNCKKRKENIELMISFDMLGYGSKKHKQDYPNIQLHKYPKNGDFLTVVTLPSRSDYAHLWAKKYNDIAKNKIYPISAPASVPGMDLSDHTSFIKNDYPAIMICDTGFYRNKNYHTESDTYDTVNFKFLTENTLNCYYTLKEITRMDKLL